jgi:hypothetical protein
MDELNAWGCQHATQQDRLAIAQRIVDEAVDTIRPQLVVVIVSFVAQRVSPTEFFRFEAALLALVRELGRLLVQAVIQTLDPDDSRSIPKDLYFRCGGYSRRSDRTRNSNIATRFGNITLWRTGYRSWQRGEETIFRLEMLLGLTENVSPALLDLMGRSLAATGMSQQATLAVIKEQCGVSMGVERLR